MNICWIAPCASTYEIVEKFFDHADTSNRLSHVFHSPLKPRAVTGKIVLADIHLYPQLAKLFPCVHYFVDDCEKCHNQLAQHRPITMQRVFLTSHSEALTFEKILFSYLTKL